MKSAIILTLLVLCVFGKFDFKQYAAPIIEKINQNKDSSWKAGLNEYFDGKSLDNIKRLLGSLQEPEWMKLPEKEQEDQIVGALPENFDSRQQWPNCESIKEVRDQSNCGSCWAFGAVEAMSDRICIQSGQKLQTKISSEDLLSCCGFSCGNGCNGGYPSAAWRYWVNNGLVTGNLYNESGYCQPYAFPPCDHHVNGTLTPCPDLPQYSTPACSKSCVSGYNTTFSNDKQFGTKSYSVTGVENIKQEIFTNGPVEASFTVYEDFLTYKSGVYVHTTGSALGGHAIKIIGWGVEGGLNYWLCTNSWNNQWGDQGFFKIKQGNCGINNNIVGGIPK